MDLARLADAVATVLCGSVRGGVGCVVSGVGPRWHVLPAAATLQSALGGAASSLTCACWSMAGFQSLRWGTRVQCVCIQQACAAVSQSVGHGTPPEANVPLTSNSNSNSPVVEDDGVSSSEVDADAAAACRQDEHEVLGVAVEALHHDLECV